MTTTTPPTMTAEDFVQRIQKECFSTILGGALDMKRLRDIACQYAAERKAAAYERAAKCAEENIAVVNGIPIAASAIRSLKGGVG